MAKIGEKVNPELLQAFTKEAASLKSSFPSLDWGLILTILVRIGISLIVGAFISVWCLQSISEANVWVRGMIGATVGASTGILALMVPFAIYEAVTEKDKGSSPIFYILFYNSPTALFLGAPVGAIIGATALFGAEPGFLEEILATVTWIKAFLGTLVGAISGVIAMVIFFALENFKYGLMASLLYDSPAAVFWGGTLGALGGAIAGAISSQF